MFSKRPPNGGKPKLESRIRQIAESAPSVPRPPTPAVAPRAARTPMFRSAVLLFASGERLEVVVKNMSRTGARVEFYLRTELPREVTLIEASMNLRKAARVV
jgi:hypothetical protein